MWQLAYVDLQKCICDQKQESVTDAVRKLKHRHEHASFRLSPNGCRAEFEFGIRDVM
jgi:hypothetical protein